MVAELLPVIIGSSGLTAIFLAIITAIVNRKKLSAEATSIISEAAGGMVQRLEAENLRLSGENASMRARIKASERVIEKAKDLFRIHGEWDRVLVIKLRELNIDMPDPPPLEWPED